MTSPDLSHILSSHHLAYGNSWQNRVNMPIHPVAIGNPYLTESLGTLDYALGKKKQVLLLGDRLKANLCLDLASKVCELFSGQRMSIVFHPHFLNEIKSDRYNSLVAIN